MDEVVQLNIPVFVTEYAKNKLRLAVNVNS